MEGLKNLNKTQTSYHRKRLRNLDASNNESIDKAFRYLSKDKRNQSRLHTQGDIQLVSSIGNFSLLEQRNTTDRFKIVRQKEEFIDPRLLATAASTVRFNMNCKRKQSMEKCRKCASIKLLTVQNSRLKALIDKLQLQNVRLQKQNSLLSEAFKHLQTAGNPQTICQITRLQNQIQNLKSSLHEQSETDKKQNRLINNLTMRMDCLSKELECSKGLNNEKAKMLSLFQNSNTELRQQMNRLQQIGLMGVEEIGSLKSELNYVRRMLKKMKDDKTKLNLEAKKMEASNQMKNYSNKRSVFDYEMHIFKNVRCFKDQKFQKKESITNLKSEEFESYNKRTQHAPKNPEAVYNFTTVDSDKTIIDLTGLNTRPSFFNFVLHEYEQAGYQPSNYHKANTIVNHMQMISTIRAIFDCMLKAFELEGTQVADFPQFVYSWLENFKVQEVSKKVMKKEKQFQSKIRFEFYTGLMSENLNDNWEVIAFREFLVQSSSLEELYYYLKMRQHLFEGDISDSLKAHIDDTLYVQATKMDSLLSLFLQNMDRINLTYLKNIIKSSIVTIKQKKYLNSAFLLRICLEYYKINRHDLYKTISANFKSINRNSNFINSNSKALVDHNQFIIYVSTHYPELNSIEKIRLYRDCYSVGAGNITADILFMTLSEKRILLRQVIRQIKNKTKPNLQPYKFISQCQNELQKLFQCKYYQGVLEMFGVESLLNERFRCHTPEDILQYSANVIKIMFYKVRKLLKNNRLQLHQCSGIYNGILLYVKELYEASVGKEQRILVKDYAIKRNLILSLEKLFLERNEAFNNHVVKMLSEVKAIAPRRKIVRKPKKPQKIISQV